MHKRFIYSSAGNLPSTGSECMRHRFSKTPEKSYKESMPNKIVINRRKIITVSYNIIPESLSFFYVKSKIQFE